MDIKVTVAYASRKSWDIYSPVVAIVVCASRMEEKNLEYFCIHIIASRIYNKWAYFHISLSLFLALPLNEEKRICNDLNITIYYNGDQEKI